MRKGEVTVAEFFCKSGKCELGQPEKGFINWASPRIKHKRATLNFRVEMANQTLMDLTISIHIFYDKNNNKILIIKINNFYKFILNKFLK